MSLRSSLIDSQSRLAEIPIEMEAVAKVAEDQKRDPTEEELTQIDGFNVEFKTVTETVTRLKRACEAAESIAKQKVAGELIQATAGGGFNQPGQPIRTPAVARHQKSKYFESNRDAFAMGMWVGAVVARKPDCERWCVDQGIGGYRAALEEGTDTLGGFTVPTPLSNQIIDLVEEWGVYRANSRNVTMTSETLAVPKLVNEIVAGTALTTRVFYPGEGGAITPGDVTFAQVLLTAVKYAQLTLLSTELNEDSVISVIDLLVRDFARNFAYSEDLNSFEGDGTATYGGISGIKDALGAGSTVTAATVAAITLDDYNEMAGRTPAYAGFQGKYYMSKNMWYTTVLPLLQAAGGTNMREIEEGGRPILNGDPVVWTQVMPSAPAAAGAQVAVYGDLDLGSYLGTRRQVSIRTLTELYAANDQIGVIGTLRSDTNIHDVGGATPATAGGITNLIVSA